jgi:hypothetical protein
MARPKKEIQLRTIASRIHPDLFNDIKRESIADDITISDVIRRRLAIPN